MARFTVVSSQASCPDFRLLDVRFIHLCKGCLRFIRSSSIVPCRLALRQKFFQHLYRSADPQHHFAQVRPVPLYFFEFGLTCFKFFPQRLKPSLHLFSHGLLLPNNKSRMASTPRALCSAAIASRCWGQLQLLQEVARSSIRFLLFVLYMHGPASGFR